MPRKKPATATTTSGKTSRPGLGVTIERELWGRTAGRCQFKGCNIAVFMDPTSKKRSSHAVIAHIIAYSPDGPRGDPVLSPRLAKDITNLMLTCSTHSKIIDDKKYEAEFSVELLRQWKKDHEDRVRELTAMLDEDKVHVLTLSANIRGTLVSIPDAEIDRALFPRWREREAAFRIQIDRQMDEGDAPYWDYARTAIDKQMDHFLRQDLNNVAVFALAPIALLVHLGYRLGDRLELDIFQRSRRSGNDKWCWDSSPASSSRHFTYPAPSEVDASLEDVAFVISISGQVDRAKVQQAVGETTDTYEIRANQFDVDFFTHREQLSLLGADFRRLMSRITSEYPNLKRLHLFLAAPVSVAVMVGASFIEKAHEKILVYEYSNPRGYTLAITLGEGR